MALTVKFSRSFVLLFQNMMMKKGFSILGRSRSIVHLRLRVMLIATNSKRAA